jgi:hypothetical protein
MARTTSDQGAPTSCKKKETPMSIRSKLTAVALAALATGSVFALGSGKAAAAVCNGTWQQAPGVVSQNVQMQCYYLPTVSNGRVTGLTYQQNFRPGRHIGRGGRYY